MQTHRYDPERWLETAVASLEEYVQNRIADYMGVPYDEINPESNLIEVVMEFPTDLSIRREIPLPNTVIHFAIDDVESRPVGLGDNVFEQNYDPVLKNVEPQEAHQHTINFDVGIWVSDEGGGMSARLRGLQLLHLAFSGSRAGNLLHSETSAGDGGLEMIRFSGGSLITERVNDLRIFRLTGAELVIRVFSRTPKPLPEPAVDSIIQQPDLTISN